MKIKDNFILRKIAGIYVVVPIGERIADFNGMLSLNETGAYIWNELARGGAPEIIAARLTREYEIDEATALKDVNRFIEELKARKII